MGHTRWMLLDLSFTCWRIRAVLPLINNRHGSERMRNVLSLLHRLLLVLWILGVPVLLPLCHAFESSLRGGTGRRRTLSSPWNLQQCSAAAAHPNGNDSAVTPATNDDTLEKSSATNVCQFCQAPFASRNALFRHLQSNVKCSAQFTTTGGKALEQATKPFSLVLKFSYFRQIHNDDCSSTSVSSEAQVAGHNLQQVIPRAIQQYLSSQLNEEESSTIPVELLGTSQSSLARLRHRALDQEVGCAAAGDTLVLRLLAPRALQFLTIHKKRKRDHDNDDDDDDNYQALVEQQQRLFLTFVLNAANELLQRDKDDDAIQVQLQAIKLWSVSSSSSDASSSSQKLLHGEQSCTQRIYHYLMPMRWLPHGEILERWWIETAISKDGSHTNRSSVRPPSDSLRQMKQLLRSVESERLDRRHAINDKDQDEEEDSNKKIAAGRFGALGEKRRQPWHNFADPQLQGSASPNTKPVWRVLDRARFEVLLTHHQNEVAAVLEFRGDDFLPQQIRRLVGTTLAMTHGWLPHDTLQVATRPDCFLETALAPAGRLYLVDNRFHWDEMRTGGKSIFESDVDGIAVRCEDDDENDAATSKIQRWILDQCDSDTTRDLERQWLSDLEHEVSPRIRRALDEWQEKPMPESFSSAPANLEDSLPPAPEPYERTLQLLREILLSGKWPETSVARSSVIGNVDRNSDETVYQRGSFTVINPKFRNGIYRDGVGNDPLPLGNVLFPELVDAVFALEEALANDDQTHIPRAQQQQRSHDQSGDSSSQTTRPVSSHCAINCNAQFTPHVDSGRGAGQSLSMIVGLGDYVGGELGVEGEAYNIRYQPLEFDGWRLRHWTKVFWGERFSLVWFTPELKGDEKTALVDDSSNYEP